MSRVADCTSFASQLVGSCQERARCRPSATRREEVLRSPVAAEGAHTARSCRQTSHRKRWPGRVYRHPVHAQRVDAVNHACRRRRCSRRHACPGRQMAVVVDTRGAGLASWRVGPGASKLSDRLARGGSGDGGEHEVADYVSISISCLPEAASDRGLITRMRLTEGRAAAPHPA